MMDCTDCQLTVLDENTISYKDDREPHEQKERIWEESWEDTLNRDLSTSTIERLNHWVATYENEFKRDDLRVLGKHLYEILFRNKKIRKTFETTYLVFDRKFKKERGSGVEPEMRLRLRLDFKKAAKNLSTYPWEFLYMPSMQETPDIEGFFFAGERTELILTRSPPPPDRSDFKAEDVPLRILIVFSHPRELATPDDEEARDAIEGIKKLSGDKSVSVNVPEWPTHATLKTEVERFEPHIVHLIAHGKPGQIALMREKSAIRDNLMDGKADNQAEWIDSASVSSLFSGHKPRLVFLQACNGAAPDALDAFNSVATSLVSFGIPAVVAMRYAISNGDAGAFAKVFYQQIGQGKDIDEAVKAGRLALGTQNPAWDHRRFGTPVVYLQNEGEKPIVYRKRLPPPDREASTSARKVPCPYPDSCSGMVMPNSAYCGLCKRPLMPCPSCKSPMPKRTGAICTACGYEVPSEGAMASASTQAATAPPSGGLGGPLVG